MKRLALALLGFGHVGRAFAELLVSKREWLACRGMKVGVTWILTSSGGIHAPLGIDLEGVLPFVSSGHKVYEYEGGSRKLDFNYLMAEGDFDTMVEMSPTDMETGGPAMVHIESCLKACKNVITANKGPILIKYRELKDIANRMGLFLGIGCTTGGSLPSITAGTFDTAGAEIISIEGILNGTTNYILNLMETDRLTYGEALKAAQDMGLAETNPSNDVEGRDTATKLLILSKALMGSDMVLSGMEVQGITGITPEDIARASEEGKRYKLIGRADRRKGILRASVAPEKIGPDNFLYGIGGSGKAVLYRTDTLGDLLVAAGASGPSYAAASLFRDLVNLGF